MPEPSLAYSLSQIDEGWRWRIYDEDGITIADGADTSRDAAEAALARVLGASGRPGPKALSSGA